MERSNNSLLPRTFWDHTETQQREGHQLLHASQKRLDYTSQTVTAKLSLDKGLKLEVYKDQDFEKYYIRYIAVQVILDN